MLELGLIFGTSLAVGFSGAMMPGPLLTVTVSETVKRGFRSGPLLVVGHGVIELILVVALALGLSQVLQRAIITQIIAVIGGAFLLWMAFGMLKGVVQGKVTMDAAASEKTGWKLPRVAAGALVSLANPYWSLWWATIGLAYVLTALRLGLAGVVAFYIGHILADFIWYSSVSAVLGSGRRFLNDFVYRSLITVCAVFLVFLSLYFITSATGVVPKFM